jgi:hypothetical protein
MTGKAEPVKGKEQRSHGRESAKPLQQDAAALIEDTEPLAVRQALHDPAAVPPAQILALQRLAGNRAVNRLIQAKLVVGAASDRYEREADQVAEQVTAREAPEGARVPIEPTAQGPVVQRAVMGTGDWLGHSNLRLRRRSPLLQKIDAALGSYHKLADQTDFGQMDDRAIRVRCHSLNFLLTVLQNRIAEWQVQKPNSKRADKVANLKRQVDQEAQEIREILETMTRAAWGHFQATSTDGQWTAKWSAEDNKYILQCRSGARLFKKDELAKVRTINSIKWSSATKALMHGTREDGVPSLWEVTVGVRKNQPFVEPPMPVVGGGKTTLRALGYQEADLPEGEEKVDMEKALYREIGQEPIADIHALAGRILNNLRAGKEIKYSTADIHAQTLRAGMEMEAVCHAMAYVFMEAVNKMACALGLPGTAEPEGQQGLLLTKAITAGFLGHDEQTPSNLVGSYSQSGRALTFAKPHPGRVIFDSHTWVKIAGRHYDPISGLSGSTEPPVQPLAKGADIDISLNGETHQVTVYSQGGVAAFSLPLPERLSQETPKTQLTAAWNQARANLSVPLQEAWVALTE